MTRIRPWLLIACALATVAATTPPDDEIPPLRPPLPKMQPAFWEAHGMAIAAIAIGLLALLAATWIVLARRRKIIVPPSPEREARAALETLRQSNPRDLGAISQATRRGLAALLDLPGWEMTTAEFCQALERTARQEDTRHLPPATDTGVTETSMPVGELAKRTGAFLKRCDALKFSPEHPQDSWDAAGEALDLIDAAAARKRVLEKGAAAA